MNTKDEKMMYRLFLDATEKQVRKTVGTRYSVKRSSALKNNSVELDTMIIKEGDEHAVPVIFLNHYFQDYLNGREIESISNEIVETYRSNRNRVDVDNVGDCSFDLMKDRIFFKLVNAERNQRLLGELPHCITEDFALIFGCLIEHGEEGIASVRVDNRVFKRWNIGMEDLARLAMENTIRMFPPKVFPLRPHNLELLQEGGLSRTGIENLLEREEKSDWADEDANGGYPGLYVLTNRDGVDGATCLVYDDLLERIGRRLGGEYYILPSSIHETLILPKDCGAQREELQRLVREVNKGVVDAMEVLSDEVYSYPENRFRITA